MNCLKHPLFALLAAFVVAPALLSCHGKEQAEAQPEPVDTIPVLATRMAQCSRLYTAEYRMRKVVIFDDPAAVEGKVFNRSFSVSLPLGKRRIAIPVTATAKAYVDMGKLSASSIHRHGKALEIVLPDPEVTLTATAIDHDGVRKQVSLLRSSFTDEEITRIQQQGRRDIVRSLSSTDILEDARRSAARQLVPMVTRMGFDESQVTITFRKDLTPEALQKLIRIID